MLIALGLLTICILPLFASVPIYVFSAAWFTESGMTASGQMPYRDFTWQYPPLGIFGPAFVVWLFGESMTTFYLLTTSLGFATVFVIYKICRLQGFGAITSLLWAFGIAGASNMATSRLIGSVGAYTPSWPIGFFGIVLIAWGVSVVAIRPKKSGGALITTGVAIALLSKQEFAVAAIVPFLLLVTFSLLSRNSFRTESITNTLLKFAGGGIALAMLAYLAVTLFTGFKPLLEGLGGYGQGIVFPPDYGPAAVELLRSLAGTTAIVALLVIGTNVYRSIGPRSLMLIAATLTTLILLISFAAELISRNQIILGTAAYVVAVLTILGMVNAIRSRATVNASIRSTYLAAFALVGATVLYESVTGLGDDHEILLLAPAKLVPWVVIIAVIAIATYFLQNAKRLDLLNDNRLVAVFALCGLAAGMQVRFVVDSGSPPDHSLTVLALLVLFRFFSLDNRIGSFRRFVSPTINVHVASMIIVGAIIPTLVFIAIGKPVLRIVRDHPTLVSTASGSFVAKSTESPTINFIASVVAKSTPNDSAVISTSFTPWVNFITDRPVLLPITQTQILEVDQHWIDESLEVLESARPTLIVEELINDDGTEYGGWGSSSRSFSPWLWSYVDENYEYCARFTDGDPRGGLWGARFYVQKTPGDSAPDCDTFKSKAGFDS